MRAGKAQLAMGAQSRISVEHFYGIEIDDFAAEVAVLSLWIAKHQMNMEFLDKFGIDLPLIPLKETGQIKAGNACREDWSKVCFNNGTDEIYLIGNPPYKGGKSQSKEMKADYPFVFGRRPHSKDLDYIALWFVKGSDYIAKTRAELAFVTTNSVSQGEHVGLMFPMIFDLGIEIGYAYTSFKWTNNATHNAGVTVAVINLRNERSGSKYLFTDGVQVEATNINGYLADAPTVFIYRRTKPLSPSLPRMALGSMPKDGGHLILDPQEKAKLLDAAPSAAKFVKKYVGSAEFINDIERYCLWIPDRDLDEAWALEPVAKRLKAVSQWRSESVADTTADYAAHPNRFKQMAYKPTESIVVPAVSSERRRYVPMGYEGANTVVSNLAFAIYDAEPWLFSVLTSRMHMAWLAAVGGRMKTDYRYGAFIVYNNFPVPNLSDKDKEALIETAFRVLDVREHNAGKTLADLYDPDKMPDELRDAHEAVDDLVDRLYRKASFDTDEERLSHLFGMYERMTVAEDSKK